MKKVTIHTDGFAGFRKRALERARKLDGGESIEPEHSITLGPSAMKVLTGGRIRVFQCVRAKNEISIPSLAMTLKRPREAVSRDVSALHKIGLVDVEAVANPATPHQLRAQLRTIGSMTLVTLPGMSGRAMMESLGKSGLPVVQPCWNGVNG